MYQIFSFFYQHKNDCLLYNTGVVMVFFFFLICTKPEALLGNCDGVRYPVHCVWHRFHSVTHRNERLIFFIAVLVGFLDDLQEFQK